MNGSEVTTQPRVQTSKREPLNREVVLEHLAILRKLHAPPDLIAIAERIVREETAEPSTTSR